MTTIGSRIQWWNEQLCDQSATASKGARQLPRVESWVPASLQSAEDSLAGVYQQVESKSRSFFSQSLEGIRYESEWPLKCRILNPARLNEAMYSDAVLVLIDEGGAEDPRSVLHLSWPCESSRRNQGQSLYTVAGILDKFVAVGRAGAQKFFEQLELLELASVLKAALYRYRETYNSDYLLVARRLVDRAGASAFDAIRNTIVDQPEAYAFVEAIASCQEIPEGDRADILRQLARREDESIREEVLSATSLLSIAAKKSILELLTEGNDWIAEEAEFRLSLLD